MPKQLMKHNPLIRRNAYTTSRNSSEIRLFSCRIRWYSTMLFISRNYVGLTWCTSMSKDWCWMRILLFNPSSAEATLTHTQGGKYFWKTPKACHFGIYWRALAENSYMSTRLPVFQSFLRFLPHFVIGNVSTRRIGANAPVNWIPGRGGGGGKHGASAQNCLK